MENINVYAYSTITSDEEKLKIGQKLLEALGNRDWNLLRSVITEDCTWSLSSNHLLSGDCDGANEVIRKAAQFADNFDLQTDHVPHCLNCVAMAIYNKATRGTLSPNDHTATVGTLRNGKISTINTFFSDNLEMNTFFPDGLST
jgi:ketosteroid isomerase-like protein